MRKLLLLLLPATLLVASCRFIAGKRIRGNGDLKTEERTQSGFSGVESHGSFDVYVSSGDQNTVKIEAEENLLPYIETYVDGDVLKITTKDGYWLSPKRSMKVYVTAPSYSRVWSYGSGDITGQTKVTGNYQNGYGGKWQRRYQNGSGCTGSECRD